jgi:hypothetical protein
MLKTDTLDSATAAHASMVRAVAHLETAIALAVSADCPRIVARLESQRKAIRGAVNHARARVSRAERGAPMRRRGLARPRAIAPPPESWIVFEEWDDGEPVTLAVFTGPDARARAELYRDERAHAIAIGSVYGPDTSVYGYMAPGASEPNDPPDWDVHVHAEPIDSDPPIPDTYRRAVAAVAPVR